MISWGIHFNPKQTCSPLQKPQDCLNALWNEEGVEIFGHRFILDVQFCIAFSHTALAAAGNHLLTQTCETELEEGCCRKVKYSFYYKWKKSPGTLLLEPDLPNGVF